MPAMAQHAPTLEDIQAAAARLQGQVEDTPCLESRTLGEILGARVFLKFENLQFTASFKERGALNKLSVLAQSGRAVVVAVGGGGLMSGMATAAHALRPDIRLVGVQTARFASMVNAVTGSTHPIGTSSIAEGIAVGRPGRLTRAIAGALVHDWQVVDEGDIEQALVMLLEIEKTLVEGAGAAGLAALLQDPGRYAGRNVGLVLCGGNIDPLRLQAIIGRGMVRAGRLARVRVEARDTPGVLARLTSVVARCGANIEEVHHQRAFTTLPVQGVEIEIVLQTRHHAHLAAVIDALREEGFVAGAC
jgi:threonine dehydratase